MTEPYPEKIIEPGAAVSAAGIGKSYGDGIAALCDVGFDLVPGSVTAVTGQSGAGKSTLLRLLSALERPDGGSIVVDGERITDLPLRALAAYRRRVGLVFERDLLLPALTLAGNVRLPAVPRFTGPDRPAAPVVGAAAVPRLPSAPRPIRGALGAFGARGALGGVRASPGRTEDAEALLAWAGLPDPGLKPAHVPLADRRRAAIARALMNRPHLVLVDEPSAELRSTDATEIVDLLLRVRDEFGATLLIATGDADVAARCDRVIRLQDGHVIDDSGALA